MDVKKNIESLLVNFPCASASLSGEVRSVLRRLKTASWAAGWLPFQASKSGAGGSGVCVVGEGEREREGVRERGQGQGDRETPPRGRLLAHNRCPSLSRSSCFPFLPSVPCAVARRQLTLRHGPPDPSFICQPRTASRRPMTRPLRRWPCFSSSQPHPTRPPPRWKSDYFYPTTSLPCRVICTYFITSVPEGEPSTVLLAAHCHGT